MKINVKEYCALILVYLFYASISVIMKWTGMQQPPTWQDPLQWPWLLGFAGLVVTLGIYAVAWQQILKRIPLGTAYMFKGTSLVFIMLLLALCFGEPITPIKLLGTAIIVVGIGLYAKA